MDAQTRRALIEQAHQLDELAKHPGWPVLVDFMLTKMKKDKGRVLDGTVKEYSEYQKLTGYFHGVHDTLDAHETVARLAENANRILAEEREDDGA